jgi:hypothetical protein
MCFIGFNYKAASQLTRDPIVDCLDDEKGVIKYRNMKYWIKTLNFKFYDKRSNYYIPGSGR